MTVFKRKAYNELLKWKSNHADDYAILLEGARRVGKSTIAAEFAKQEYRSYILIDFSNASSSILECFDDISNLDLFFTNLQARTEKRLYPHESVIIFDEIQLFSKARQAIKHLVADGRYHYIETGSLISIKRNVSNILIPSEEMKINVYPMDYEEFYWATNKSQVSYDELADLINSFKDAKFGQSLCDKYMRDLRIYMAVGGMPQAVKAYIDGHSFEAIDDIKRTIIKLYEDDLKKIDHSGRVSTIFHAIPSQLAMQKSYFHISQATDKRFSSKDTERLSELIDSKIVLPCYNCTDPKAGISTFLDLNKFKLYLTDTGLFVTLMFYSNKSGRNALYAQLLSNKLPYNLGYLYENLVAQIIASTDRGLYYHLWKDSSDIKHYYEVDFLVEINGKVSPLEIKSSKAGKHRSILEFKKKYPKGMGESYILSQSDGTKADNINFLPIFMLPLSLLWKE